MHPRILESNIVEKILRDKEGRLARVTFNVYEKEGRVLGRILKVEYIAETSDSVLALRGSFDENNNEFEIVFDEQGIISLFFDSSLIYTIGTKPRAPTFI